MNDAGSIVREWINGRLFNAIPMGIAIIDPDYNLLYANKKFEEMFGKWRGRKCYQVYKRRNSMCSDCKGADSFRDGVPRVNEEVGYDKNGNLILYLQHTTPVLDERGKVLFLIEICTDITESEQIRQEHELLFDQVPCNILLIDRDFRIVRTNVKVKELLGDLEGQFCFETLKGLKNKCKECTARQTFQDGQMHTGHHVWKTPKGGTTHLHVITIPVMQADGHFQWVMEMAVDITKTMQLEEGLRFAHNFMETVISTSIDGIFAVNKKGKVTLFNPAARKIFNVKEDQIVSREDLASMLPEGFLAKVFRGSGHVSLPDTTVKTMGGEEFPARLVGNKLAEDDLTVGMAFSIQNLSHLKQLEKEKLEAERLAAVGQTVAGLAHGVKNLITALEGGMYMLNSGLSNTDIERIQKGMVVLDRNIDRISLFVKAFLDFSKGRTIKVKLCRPDEIVNEVVELYSVKARKLGIKLVEESPASMEPAPIDYESMHECLTNLVGNAIDACQLSETPGGYLVTVKTYEENGNIIYEVSDNGCGMDYEVKKKVFTTFFTTKGLGGSGLGLLMTKKIVQEHGGKIDLQSDPDTGTTFRITLPRNLLPQLMEKS